MILFFCVILIIVLILLRIAFVTLFEREILGLRQNRLSPNKIIFFGILQALVDGLKLVKKELVLPKNSSDLYFIFIPILRFLIIYLEWFLLPYFFNLINWQYSVIFLFCLIGLMVYTSLLRGLIRKSKYAFLGSIRSRSQSISFEIIFSLYFIALFIFIKSFELNIFINFFNLVFFFLFVLIILVELNRAPFDFSEGERELVSGFNVEYRSFSFALLFLAEYGSLIFFRVLVSFIFFSGSLGFIYLIFIIFLLIRRAFPRFRYDFLINLFWFKLLPLRILYFFFVLVFVL